MGRAAERNGGRGLFAVACALVILVAGCGGPPRSSGKPGTAKADPSARGPVSTVDYPLRGVVRSVAPDDGRVLIHHEDIPGLMKAMSMPFKLRDGSMLGLLNPGDEVEGTLHVERQDGAVVDYELRDLKVTKPAPAKGIVLDTSRGKAVLRERPPLLRVGEPVPDFTMTGQDGHLFRLSDLEGKVVVLTFIYTRCPMPDFCPLMDRKFSDLAQHLSAFPKRAEHVRLLSVSFDPENDTPEVLRKHAAIRGASPPLWRYAVASHDELARVAPRLGLTFGADGKDIAHNLCTAIIDAKGRLARLEVGRKPNNWETADFLRTIYGLLPTADK